MELSFVPKEPGIAYVSNSLWLPKDKIRAGPVQRALEFVVQNARGQLLMRMWSETSRHIICPREFIPSSEYPKYDFPFIDLRPEFSRVSFTDHVVPRDEEQVQAWAALQSHDNGILNLGCGKGKALAHGQRVLTARGFIPIEQVTVEDQTAGTDGRFHQVVGVFPQGERDIYRVAFTDGTHLDCDGDHLWTFVLRRTKGKPSVTITTKELLEKPLRGVAGRLYYLPPIAPVEWQPGVFKVDPYTLGALLGDGHLSKRNLVEFTTMDSEMLSFMKLPPYHRFMVVPGRRSGRATTYRISMSRNDTWQKSGARLPDLLRTFGVMGHTAHSKFVPDAYKYASSWERLAVIQGLLDTDGSPTASGAAEYATVSTQLADDMTDMVLSLGGTCIRQHRTTRCNGKEFESLRLLVKLPQGMPLFRLSRKLEKLPPSRQREPYRAVDSVTYLEKSLATCISVSSQDQLFLAEDYIPTHNTVLSLKKIAQRGTPTLVIVPDTGILDQWKLAVHGDEGKGIVKGLEFDGELGLIQGPVFKWAHPITLALVTSLWQRIEKGLIPEEMFRYFGLIIYDESLPFSARVLTSEGYRAIGELTASDAPLVVTSFDIGTKKFRKRKVTKKFSHPPKSKMLKITHEHGIFYCTANHEVLTPLGYVRAKDLVVGVDTVVYTTHGKPELAEDTSTDHRVNLGRCEPVPPSEVRNSSVEVQPRGVSTRLGDGEVPSPEELVRDSP